MYRYDEFDTAYVKDRVASFRRQVERRIRSPKTNSSRCA